MFNLASKVRGIIFLVGLFFSLVSYCQVFQEEKEEYRDEVHFILPKYNIIKELNSTWNQRIMIDGYVQARYNELYQSNKELEAEQMDRSVGKNKGFFLRRVRTKITGQLNEYIYAYLQTDFGGGNVSLRDAYMDISLDLEKEYRFRIGQSKVPYSFENLQSSQNRLSLDRAESTNSSFRDERDIGIFFFWTSKEAQNRYSFLVKSGLRGSGNYGVLAVGVFNGQRINQLDANPNKHLISRLNYPFFFSNGQILELGVSGYFGKHVLVDINKGVLLKNGVIADGTENYRSKEFTDQRIGWNMVFYPQPIGIQLEYNLGKGPEFNSENKAIETKNLTGGYLMVSSRLGINKNHVFSPFIKYQFYKGGKKHEIDARSYRSKDLEIGLEWQPNPFFEINMTFMISDRKYLDFNNLNKHEKGNILRIQTQLNF